MKIRMECPGCGAPYQVAREKLAGGKSRFSCKRCGHRWMLQVTNEKVRITPLTAGKVLCPHCGHTFAPQAASPSRGRQRILLAEDNDFFLKLARDALDKEYDTIAVRTTDAALNEIGREHPDLLVLDLVLAGGGNGLDILRRFPERKFPVLIYTSKGQELDEARLWEVLRNLGVNDIVTKGINVGDELKRKVEGLLHSGR
jgi:predicted Zn finger-like uncharacterized protein